MKTETQNVSPAQARAWLTKNTDNRPLRPGVVNGLHAAYGRGEWKLNHQGIAFGPSGRLLDGQHRLTFISQLPEGSRVPLLVTTGMPEEVFYTLDQGFRRTVSDVLGVSAAHASVGKFFARISNSGQITGLSVQSTAPFVEWATPELSELLTYCPSAALIWSSAPVRSAAVFQMKRGHDPDFIKLAYHSLVHTDIDAMPYAARVLMQQRINGKIVSARSTDLFCRALRVFDSKHNTKIATILVKNMSAVTEDVRAFMAADMKGPAYAGLKVAKPAVKFMAKGCAA